ncbi:eukaryotic translation initiation factor eIF2A-domain-containing protein [Gilbertella persicaria]|uniref:eukaryotic translation initiation factor eIF2A-domain-containing protein n=1 Tax=Gilbertella persicaria TaxID=101096 RepID=UPI0022209648|nr:eukaryotic translation initiation factor eIF2A-domain-containing protein [Gilbertella persicaria]KAI8052584.1 eukaryotic translation initiation factor eIF2A-domain-containing protein [Gilbertella persicaria]
MPGVDWKNLPEREEDINFDDIYEKHRITTENDFDTIVVVDGAPIVDEAKEEKLLAVLNKLFTKGAGDIKENGIWMPMTPNEEGKKTSSGYLFIDFKSAESAHAAVKNLDGHKLSKTVTLSVNKFTDVEKYSDMSEEYVEPEIPPYTPKEHLKSALMDPLARDQFVMYRGDDVSIFWNRKTEAPEHVYTRTNWTETYVQWSPKGTYLSTFHTQGIALWGGPSWNKIVRFVHPGVKLIDFSPNERYLVTWSNEPISLARLPESGHPFSEYDEGNQIIIWDIKTGSLLRTFPLVQTSGEEQKTVRWPMFKWSASEKHFARVVPGQQLSIYEAPSMGLVGKKSVKIQGIVDFEWSPAKGDTSDAKIYQKEEVLAYWTPEVGNQPARVCMMSVPSKEVIATKNLFNVSECKLYWQNQGHFLAVKVDRHTKTKKSTFSNIEIFRVKEKNIPVETIEMKDPMLAFAWEPYGERFATITTSDPNYGATPAQGQNPATIKTDVKFFYLDTSKKANAGFKLMKSLDKKTANYLFWSPKGHNIVLATLRSSSVFDLEFYDIDFEPLSSDKKNKNDVGASVQLLSTQDHYGVSDVEWDPTGRYVVTGSSMWRHSADHGFCIWDFKGQLLFKQNIENFKQLLWRPRPESLLTAEQKKKIKKNLRQYSKQFDEEDLAIGDATAAKLHAERRKAIEEWYAWRKTTERKLEEERKASGKQVQLADEGKSEVVEEWVEEVIDEIEEIIE